MEEERQRPNAKYNLSKPDIPGKEELVFHYSRERRLEKAPQLVKDLYAPKKQHSRFNLLRPLIADRPRALLFFVIIIMFAVINVFNLAGRFGRTYILDGNRIEISAITYDGITIVVLRKTVREPSAFTGAVDVAVSPVVTEGEDFQIFTFRIFFTLEEIEEYRFTVPFDARDQLIVLQTENSTVSIRFTAD